MCVGGSEPKYTPPPTPPEAPRMADAGAQQARGDEKRRQRMAAGRSSTIKTSGGLLGGAETTGSTGGLLGG